MLDRESGRAGERPSGKSTFKVRRAAAWVLPAFLALAAAGKSGAAPDRFANILPKEQLKNEYSSLASGDPAWKTLVAGAWSMGYSPTTRWWNPSWGEDAVWGANGRSVTLRWRVFDLDNIGSPDAGALFYVTDGTRTYRGLVVARDKDPLHSLEYGITGSAGNYKMVETNGFWSCAQRAMNTQCGSQGPEALKNCMAGATLVTGDFSWSAYMKSLVSTAFGSCALPHALTCLDSAPPTP